MSMPRPKVDSDTSPIWAPSFSRISTDSWKRAFTSGETPTSEISLTTPIFMPSMPLSSVAR